MKKQTKILIIIVAVLIAAIIVFAVLNAENTKNKKELADTGGISIKMDDKVLATVDLAKLEGIGMQDIDANLKKDGQAAEPKVYRGTPLTDVFKDAGIDVTGKKAVIFSASDGYSSAYTTEEAVEEGNLYIVAYIGGEPLGSKEDGGSGPYMLISKKDSFSQRWCKYLLEIEIN